MKKRLTINKFKATHKVTKVLTEIAKIHNYSEAGLHKWLKAKKAKKKESYTFPGDPDYNDC